MDTGTFLESIRDDLRAIAGDEPATTAVAERLARALESSLQLRLLDAMGQVAVELSDQLPAGHVEVRLAGRDVQLVFVSPEEPTTVPPAADEEGGTARVTLRLPDGVKARVEQAADGERISTNTWLVRAITRGLDSSPGRRRGGNRITGFAQG